LQSGALWEAKEAWDVLTLWYEDGYKPRCFTSQVRHSKNYKSHQWNFRTIDNKKKRRYDMFVGVGYLPLPEDAEVEYMNSTYHHLHPKNTEVFLIPVEDITTASIQINKTRFHEQSGKQNKYWQYNIPLHSNIRKAMQRAAQGLPIHVSYQATLDFGV
jgi:hypothetical protein